jgi:hypothetical protein
MDFITEKQFLEQSEHTQNILIKYMQDKKIAHMYLSNTGEVRYGHNHYDTPLFTETDLRKFIEERTGGQFSMKYHIDKKYYVFEFATIKIFELGTLVIYTDNLLEAYWQIVCKICNLPIK